MTTDEDGMSVCGRTDDDHAAYRGTVMIFFLGGGYVVRLP